MIKLKRPPSLIIYKKPKFVLTAIAVLTLIAWFSTAVVLGLFMYPIWLMILISVFIGVIGIYAYHKVALMFLHMRFNK